MAHIWPSRMLCIFSFWHCICLATCKRFCHPVKVHLPMMFGHICWRLLTISLRLLLLLKLVPQPHIWYRHWVYIEVTNLPLEVSYCCCFADSRCLHFVVSQCYHSCCHCCRSDYSWYLCLDVVWDVKVVVAHN